jgi:hypothetical protein
MECNVLGNGPSRVLYKPNKLISIGCKFPWTKVDYTTLVCRGSVNAFVNNSNLIPIDTKIILKEKSYCYIIENNYMSFFEGRIEGIYSDNKNFRRSVGHDACIWMIEKGYKKINLYGIDHYFGDLAIKSYTTDMGIDYPKNMLRAIESNNQFWFVERRKQWMEAWDSIFKKYPDVIFNFVN